MELIIIPKITNTETLSFYNDLFFYEICYECYKTLEEEFDIEYQEQKLEKILIN
jgi:hypothetical protein